MVRKACTVTLDMDSRPPGVASVLGSSVGRLRLPPELRACGELCYWFNLQERGQCGNVEIGFIDL